MLFLLNYQLPIVVVRRSCTHCTLDTFAYRFWSLTSRFSPFPPLSSLYGGISTDDNAPALHAGSIGIDTRILKTTFFFASKRKNRDLQLILHIIWWLNFVNILSIIRNLNHFDARFTRKARRPSDAISLSFVIM